MTMAATGVAKMVMNFPRQQAPFPKHPGKEIFRKDLTSARPAIEVKDIGLDCPAWT